jgi:glyoxylase-like metal-dependent hydrolase (beta-lactamase superfamily II)
MRELQPGLWHWRAPHPEWQPAAPYPADVSSYAIDDSERLLLFDPLAVPDRLLALAAEREPVIVLTAPWHERDTQGLVERLGAPVYAPPPDTAEDLVHKFGITAEQAGEGSPDLAWLRGSATAVWHAYGAGDALPVAIEAFAGREHNDMVLWVRDREAVVCGDTLVDFGDGFRLNRRLRAGVTREEVVERLRALLDRPVALVLPAHGAPTDRAALERALRFG